MPAVGADGVSIGDPLAASSKKGKQRYPPNYRHKKQYDIYQDGKTSSVLCLRYSMHFHLFTAPTANHFSHLLSNAGVDLIIAFSCSVGNQSETKMSYRVSKITYCALFIGFPWPSTGVSSTRDDSCRLYSTSCHSANAPVIAF